MTLPEVYYILKGPDGAEIQQAAMKKINNYDYDKSLNIIRKNLEEDNFEEVLFEGDAVFFGQFTQNLITLYLTMDNPYLSVYMEAWCLLLQNAITEKCFGYLEEEHPLRGILESAIQLLNIKNIFSRLCIMSDFVFGKYDMVFGKEKIRSGYAKDFIDASLEEK